MLSLRNYAKTHRTKGLVAHLLFFACIYASLCSYPDNYRRARQVVLPVSLCSGPYIRLDEVPRQAEPHCRCMNPPRP
ncbi:hypothetical protein EV421DRAFT_1850026, partial [Armillaria borealis]